MSSTQQQVAPVLIRGGTVVNADGERRADVLCVDGRIAAVGDGLEAPMGARTIDAGTTATLRAVATVSATEEIAVGDDGAIVRLLGDRVLSVPVEGTPDLLGIVARNGVATVVGEAGTVIRITDGHPTLLQAPTSQTLRAVGGCDEDLYVAGDEGVLLRQMRDGWRPVRLEPESRAMFTSISCDHGRTVVVGADGEVRLVSGLRSVKLETDFDGVLTGVSGAADEATWIVGTSGRLSVVVSDHVETRVAGPIASLRDIADVGGALVAVGDWGKLIREHEDGLVLDQAPVEAGLGSVARLGDGSLVAVGDGGVVGGEHLLFDRQGAAELDDRLLRLAHRPQRDAEVVVAAGRHGRLGPEDGFAQGERSGMERQRFVVFALPAANDGFVVRE